MSESDIPKSLEELREIIVKSIEKEVCFFNLFSIETIFVQNILPHLDSKHAKLQEFNGRGVCFLQIKMLVEVLHNAKAIRL
jgi:hypothetical protein